MRQQHASVQSRIAASVCLSRNASSPVRHLTASKDDGSKHETYLMLRLRKGLRSQTKRMSHLASTLLLPRRKKESLRLIQRHSQGDTHTSRHRYIYITKQETCASVFIMLHSKSVCCFLFVRYFKFNYPVMKWAATDMATATAAAPNAIPWLPSPPLPRSLAGCIGNKGLAPGQKTPQC